MTRLLQPGGPIPPRIWPLWDAVLLRLDSARMRELLEPLKGRVYGPHEDPSEMEAEKAPWARVVVLPVSRAFEVSDDTGGDRVVPFLVRADVSPPHGGRWNSMRVLEALHQEVWERLHGWVPGLLEELVLVQLPPWRETAPQAWPLWDEGSGTHFISAEWRCVAEPREEEYHG